MATWTKYEEAVKEKDGRPLYGMDVELAQKQKEKFDPEKQRDVMDWIQSVLEERFDTSNIQDALKDGVALCKLVNKVKPGAVKKISTGNMSYLQLENLQQFLNACQTLGLPSRECFATSDLYEGKNLPWVIESLHTFAKLICGKSSYKGPQLGVRLQTLPPNSLPQRRAPPSPRQDSAPPVATHSVPTTTTTSTGSVDPYAELEKLANLKNKGIVTEEEFNLKKKQLLGL